MGGSAQATDCKAKDGQQWPLVLKGENQLKSRQLWRTAVFFQSRLSGSTDHRTDKSMASNEAPHAST